MSRSGYGEDFDNWSLICWRGAVKRGIRGKRGQKALRDIVAALDALPEKRLAAGSLVTPDGEFCTLGSLGRLRGMDMSQIDAEDRDAVAKAFGVSVALAAEIMYLNDEYLDDHEWVQVEICGPVRPGHPEWGRHTKCVSAPAKRIEERRWQHMRDWAQSNIIEEKGYEKHD